MAVWIHSSSLLNFLPPDDAGRLSDSQWRQTYDVNVIGHAMVARRPSKFGYDRACRKSDPNFFSKCNGQVKSEAWLMTVPRQP